MAVTLTISEVNGGGNMIDSNAGGSLGMDMGTSSAGIYGPLVNVASNLGHQDIIVRHDAINDPITDVVMSIAAYSGVYGGNSTAALDYNAIGQYGIDDAASAANTANNSDGLSRGLHIDMDWQAPTVTQFGYTRETTNQMRIFGKTYTGKNGLTVLTAFPVHVDAMSYWNGSTEVDAATPITSQIGKNSDTVRGNQAHIRSRFYLHGGETNGGILQWDTVFTYAATS